MSVLSNDLRTLSHEAYIYLYPLVTMEVTRQQAVNVEPGTKPGFGPANEFSHLRTFPDADFRAVVRPNFDTLYSSAWLDLGEGPVILHAPDTDDRYYMLPLLDMWTDVFATIGKRSTGTGEQDYAIVGPGFTGDLPGDFPVIHSPTRYAWVIGRTQTNGPDDYPAVNAIQDGFKLTAPASFAPDPIDPEHDTSTEALKIVNAMSAVDFFSFAAEALKENPPHVTDFSTVARIAGLGIVPGQSYDASGFTDSDLAEIEAGAKDALNELLEAVTTFSPPVNGWTTLRDTMGVYGNFYFKRAFVTLVGLGANPAEDAIYPLLITDADGELTSGEHNYVIHFDADKLPPVFAFWSITMYDAEGFQVANELDRFAIGDRDPLTYNDDGSLDIYVQHARPDESLVSNWLPAPSGPLGITMRLYAPKPEALNGEWTPPVVRKNAS